MNIKKLIEAYIIIDELELYYPNDFILIDDFYKGCNHNVTQYIKDKIIEKIKELDKNFINEPFIIDEYIGMWSVMQHKILFSPKKIL